jgi:hypothetical protein
MKSEDLVSTFIRFAEAEKDSAVYEESFWAYDELSSMGLDRPLEALSVILAVLSRSPGPKAIELLAAGPLEDLLVENCPLVIDEIERRAESDSNVAMLLGGVWQSEMNLDVWKRIEKARSRKWWGR